MNLCHGVFPFFEVLAQVLQRVSVLGEDEQLSPAIGEFLELGACEAFVKRGEFGVGGLVAHATGTGMQFLKRGDFCAKLVEFKRGRELIG